MLVKLTLHTRALGLRDKNSNVTWRAWISSTFTTIDVVSLVFLFAFDYKQSSILLFFVNLSFTNGKESNERNRVLQESNERNRVWQNKKSREQTNVIKKPKITYLCDENLYIWVALPWLTRLPAVWIVHK